MQLNPDAITWLFLDMNSFFASVEQQECPAYIGKPLIVVPSDTDATCAIAASYEAKAIGIKTGTNVGDARAKCPGLICVPARHDVYLRYHNMILECVVKDTPITKVCSIDELASRLPPLKANPEAATKVALSIKARMHAQIGPAVTCSIGLSSNIFLSKMATDLQKPDGLVILPPRDAYTRLKPLRLTDLTGIGRNMERRLNKCGIWTVEQLWQCSAKHMRGIWRSVEGERFWYKLRGYDIPSLPTSTSVVGHSRVLEPRFRDPQDARAVLSQLTEKACNRMRRKGYAAKAMHISMREVLGSGRYGAEITFSPPCQDNIICVRAMHQLYDRIIARHSPSRLQKVSVTFTNLLEQDRIHPDLFHDYAAPPSNNVQETKTMTTAAAAPQPTATSHHQTLPRPAVPRLPHGGLYHRPFKERSIHEYDMAAAAAAPTATTTNAPAATGHNTPEARARHKNLSRSIDHIIKTFGSDSIHFGCTPEAKSKYVGTKIAFNRIPDQEEFL